MKAKEIMEKYYKNRSLASREWKAKGGKVVGYFCTNTPEEIISAAGLLPVRLTGDPQSGTEMADRHMEYFFCPVVRSIYNMILIGKYDFLDLLVIPHACDSVIRTYHYLTEERRIDPGLKIPELYVFDMLHTRYGSSNVYIRDRVRAFKKKLEEFWGRIFRTRSYPKLL